MFIYMNKYMYMYVDTVTMKVEIMMLVYIAVRNAQLKSFLLH